MTELLVVMAVVAIMITLVAPAVMSIGGSASLNGAGGKVSSLIDRARQQAMSQNALTAVLIAVDGDLRYRALTMLTAPARTDGAALTSGDWKQTSGWELLPTGVSADSTPFVAESSVPINPTLPSLRYNNVTMSHDSFRYIAFLPNGKLYKATNPPTIKLVEANWPKDSSPIVYTHRNSSGAANYYEICVIPSTGRLLINRP